MRAALTDYATLRVIWWLILGVLLIGFAITDGFDLGVGATFRILGRTDAERRAVLGAIEPVWEGNQVWFILGGGATFAAWPLLYAASFSGLYLAMFLLLVALILRPVGFKFRDKVPSARWRASWDAALILGGSVPALLFGVAFANLFLGVPFSFDTLLRPVVTGTLFSLLHPFALLGGIVSLSMLVMHGSAYAAMKVGEPMATRACGIGRVSSAIFVAAFVAAGIWVSTTLGGYVVSGGMNPVGPSDPTHKTVVIIAGAWLNNFHEWPWAWGVPGAAVMAALAAHVAFHRRRAGAAFAASALVQSGTILTGGIALFPFMLPSSSFPNQSLTVWDASSSAKTLTLMLGAVVVLLPVVLSYTAWAFKVFKGRVTLDGAHLHGEHY